ncbi:MAG TPA: ATP-binding protein [Chloroflexia bacterium]|nr:ATP-binding protein [Chloroflexia bacterium]
MTPIPQWFDGRRPIPLARRWMDRLVAADRTAPRSTGDRLRDYGLTTVALALVTAGFWPVREWVGLLNIGLVYLVTVVGAATLAGRGAGLWASVLGFLLFNFFLVPPYLTFVVADLANVPALFVFLGVAALASTLIGRARAEAAQARRRARDLQGLYALGQAALAASRREAILPALVAQVVTLFAADSGWILLPRPGTALLHVAAVAPAGARALTEAEGQLAQQVYARGVLTGPPGALGSPERDMSAGFAPLRAEGRVLGVLGVSTATLPGPHLPIEPAVLAPLADQVALALSRIELREAADRAAMLEQTDALKSALVHAVSHDLRTPLAAIKATVTSLLDPAMHWDAATERLFLEGVDEECDRLTRLVSNLLDMSRIEGGALHVQRDWYAISEVVDTVRQRLAGRLAGHPLDLDLPADLPLVPIDFIKIDQVVSNLLENAIKYTPPGTPIHIGARASGGWLRVTVADDGPGLAAEHLDRLFDKFYRVAGAGAPAGSGLGLAIAQGMVRAHGGTMSVQSTPGQGLCVAFTLPLALDGAGAAAAADTPEEAARGR